MPKGPETRQVYGFVFNSDGRILFLEDEGMFNLPGGRPENGETMGKTLIREVLEEVQVTIFSPEYLGFQLVTTNEEFAQVGRVRRSTDSKRYCNGFETWSYLG